MLYNIPLRDVVSWGENEWGERNSPLDSYFSSLRTVPTTTAIMLDYTGNDRSFI